MHNPERAGVVVLYALGHFEKAELEAVGLWAQRLGPVARLVLGIQPAQPRPGKPMERPSLFIQVIEAAMKRFVTDGMG